jgi:tight adherence protein B
MTVVAPVVAGVLVLLTAAAVAGGRDAAVLRRPRHLLLPPTVPAGALLTRHRVWAAGLLLVPVAVAPLAGPGLGVVAAAGWMAAPRIAAGVAQRRAVERYDAAVPEALEGVARGLRSGAGLTQAVAEVGAHGPLPLRPDLAAVVATAQRGGGIVAGLEEWAERVPRPGVRLAVAALCLGAETGGAQARAVDGVASSVRQRLAAVAEARALATQARASAAVIALAPIGFCGVATTTDPRVGAFLFRSPAGLAVLVTGVGLDALGAWWMARLTRLEP